MNPHFVEAWLDRWVGLFLEVVIQQRNIGPRPHLFSHVLALILFRTQPAQVLLEVPAVADESICSESSFEHGSPFERTEWTGQIDASRSKNLANCAYPIIIGHLLDVDAILVDRYVAQRTDHDEILLLIVSLKTYLARQIFLFDVLPLPFIGVVDIFDRVLPTHPFLFLLLFYLDPLIIHGRVRSDKVVGVLLIAVELFEVVFWLV